MAAKSKAYTTDDGRTAVKEDSSASSQVHNCLPLFDGNLEFGYKSMRSRPTGSGISKVLTVLQVIAATTESPDGRTKSTMSYTSSNSSSSSTMTSSSGALGTMPSMPGRRGGQALL